VSFMLFSLYLGIGIMALIGKWAWRRVEREEEITIFMVNIEVGVE
jgi:hypothetical protein